MSSTQPQPESQPQSSQQKDSQPQGTQPKNSQPRDSQPKESKSLKDRRKNAWAPVVLALDGGGVRGLSSLYILREIMQAIKDIDETESGRNLETGTGLPLPCNYFDFMIGTSTGGLIAVMLGRLRMGIEDCIQQYWIMSIKIFRPYHIRIIRMYSRRVLQESAKDVIKTFCRCHHQDQEPCRGYEDLRQYDFIEAAERGEPDKLNKTCKVAVLTVREKGTTDFQGGSHGSGDTNILFRSYNHLPRPSNNGEHNPKTLNSSKLAIHEACSATTAAPTYFHSVRLRGRKYIDGGVWANNPAMVAWNEAVYMGESPYNTDEDAVMPEMLLSIGTGVQSAPSRLGFSIVGYGFRKITDTSTAEEHARSVVTNVARKHYYRFDVPETEGLRRIGLAECKKKKIRRLFHKQPVEAPTQTRTSSSTDGTPVTPERSDPIEVALEVARDRDTVLRQDALLDPHNFKYKTFDRIRDQTVRYVRNLERDAANTTEIQRCARLIWSISRERKDVSEDMWRAFTRHPNPTFQV